MAFAVVYLGVFGFGVWYLLSLMAHAPHAGESGPEADPEKPTRTAGITPGPPTDRLRPTGRTHAESKRS